mmetsp:Transcript_30730/g.51747  ORF Transcript_30730/g.51747 Transcript_30730/m.51747 type:complete len:201 (+) Transcript_30730:343-945(+)
MLLRLFFVLVHLLVVVYRVHIAVIQQLFQHGHVCLVGLVISLNIAQGHEREARGLGVDVLPRLQQRIAHRAERSEVRRHLEPAFCARLNIFCPRLQCQLEQLFLVGLFDYDVTFSFKVEHHAPRLGHVAPALPDNVSHVRRCAVLIIGQTFDDKTDPSETIRLVRQQLEIALFVIRRVFQVAFDKILWHARAPRHFENVL